MYGLFKFILLLNLKKKNKKITSEEYLDKKSLAIDIFERL